MKCLEEPFSIMYTKQGTGIIRHFLTKKERNISNINALSFVRLCLFSFSSPPSILTGSTNGVIL